MPTKKPQKTISKKKPKTSRTKTAATKKAPKKTSVKKRRTMPTMPVALAWRQPLPGEVKIGVVQDYYSHINVIALTLEQPLSVGATIHVHGHTTDLTQNVDSMQIGHQSVPQANAGDGIGVKVTGRCRKGDYVYKML